MTSGTRATILSNSFKENGHVFLLTTKWPLSCSRVQETLTVLVTDIGTQVKNHEVKCER